MLKYDINAAVARFFTDCFAEICLRVIDCKIGAQLLRALQFLVGACGHKNTRAAQLGNL